MDVKEFLYAVKKLCKSLGPECDGCPFSYKDDDYPHYLNCRFTTYMPEGWDVEKIIKIYNHEQKLHDLNLRSREVVKIKVLPGGRMPEKKTAGAAAWDCYARIDVPEAPKDEMWIPKGHRGAKVPLGFAMEIPEGYHAEIFLRSSTGAKTPFRVSNSAGIIDSDYRGEVCALIDNINWCMPEVVRDGDRIVQMLIVKDPDVELVEADELSKTDRGASSFGSTGKR